MHRWAACVPGLGVPPKAIGGVLGVAKAYTTRVGEGPLPTELSDEVAERLRESGQEYGASTGRPRRCGWFDAVVVRYSAACERTRRDRVDQARRARWATRGPHLHRVPDVRRCHHRVSGRPAGAGIRGAHLRDAARLVVADERREGVRLPAANSPPLYHPARGDDCVDCTIISTGSIAKRPSSSLGRVSTAGSTCHPCERRVLAPTKRSIAGRSPSRNASPAR